MAPMPELRISDHTFVLTGRMWKDRGDIHQDIVRKGGKVSKTMRKGYILVMASSQLERNEETGKWSTIGKATGKATAAMQLGAVVYHEKMLRDALADPNGRSSTTRVGSVSNAKVPQTREDVAPEWDDAMQAQLDKNLAETSELLASF